jgi:hypothetical protein
MVIHKHGYVDLCSAVIKQWNADGKPSTNKETIDAWTRIMLELVNDGGNNGK